MLQGEAAILVRFYNVYGVKQGRGSYQLFNKFVWLRRSLDKLQVSPAEM